MDRFTARRRLLRGSLSAPLVLTVASPSALADPVPAARQSFEACLRRAGNANEQGVEPFVESPDTWLRSSVPTFDVKLKDSSTVLRVYILDGAYYDTAACGPAYSESSFETINPTGSMLGLVYVDNAGNIVPGSFGACQTGGFPVSASCWASFTAGRDP